MKEYTAQELEKRFSIKQMQSYNSKIRNDYNALQLEYKRMQLQQEATIQREVKIRTQELTKKLEKKEKEIEALKQEIAKLQSKMNNNSWNSGMPTSKTGMNQKKIYSKYERKNRTSKRRTKRT